MNKLVLALSLFLLTNVIYAQRGPRRYYEEINVLFENLDSGAILVRLKTDSIKIAALEQRNQFYIKTLEGLDKNSKYFKKTKDDIERRERLIAKIKINKNKYNQSVIDAFQSFSFCNIYFFYATDSKKILNRNFTNNLLDRNLNIADSIPILSNNYLIAEFGATTKDTAIIMMHKGESSSFPGHPNKYIERDNEGKIYYKYYDYSSTSMEGGVDALVLFSPDFVQLQAPYPHYVRTFENLLILERNKSKTVKMLQYKIEQYRNAPWIYWIDPTF